MFRCCELLAVQQAVSCLSNLRELNNFWGRCRNRVTTGIVKHVLCKEQLRDWGWLSREERDILGDLTAAARTRKEVIKKTMSEEDYLQKNSRWDGLQNAGVQPEKDLSITDGLSEFGSVESGIRRQRSLEEFETFSPKSSKRKNGGSLDARSFLSSDLFMASGRDDRSVSSGDLLKVDFSPVGIQATDENIEPQGHKYEYPIHSLPSSNWMLIMTF
ncbi:hypothetical protein llap_7737 [Limosa lapponica baueri]|uniref:Uncharacterized protein n=1 Tax=Limosa lapponica baueri TaxID=1758121 RepID=A0A2I0U7F8_LIMLA|nr:hypothetical protein llap_7737 [Limosa lapponica baueri]